LYPLLPTAKQWLHVSQPSMKGRPMDFIEKAKRRIQHWIMHNNDHMKEYDLFAGQLESAGKHESARHIREMTALTAESNDCLAQALRLLK
jgi:hypothetical protein